MRKGVIFFLSVFVLAVLTVGGGIFWQNQKEAALAAKALEETQDFQLANLYVSERKWSEALPLILRHQHDIELFSTSGVQWLDLLIKVSRAQGNISQLMVLYRAFPSAFDNNEEASLMVAESYLADKNDQEFNHIRDSWRGRELELEKWTLLDTRQLIQKHKYSEAISHLSTSSFENLSHEIERLTQLALLHQKNQDTHEAWTVLTQAYRLDPHNAEIRSYRGRILESLGKNHLALNEYLAALEPNPENIYLIDQVAEFHLRQKEFSEAVAMWVQALNFPSLDHIWLKALFWNRVATPANFAWNVHKFPKTSLMPLIEYLSNLPDGKFWDYAVFDKIPDNQRYLFEQQATYWFQLLQLLKEGQELEALTLIQESPFKGISWDPLLEQALYQMIAYRQNLPLETWGIEDNQPTILDEINHYASQQVPLIDLPQQLRRIIQSDEAFTAALLVAGWKEAALQLQKGTSLSPDLPDWISYEIAQAYWENHGSEAALKYAIQQKQIPEMSLMIADLLVQQNKLDDAEDHLKGMIYGQDDYALEAALMLSELYMLKGEYNEAKILIQQRHDLAQSVPGKEILAKVALKEGNVLLADSLYLSIESDSLEAQNYLVRQAMREKDWKKAMELTLKLLVESPSNPYLLGNLQKIREAEQM